MPPQTCEGFRPASVKSPARVLVVDHEPLVCWALAAGLRQAGFCAETASTAEEALALARVSPPPNAIVIDARILDCPSSILLRRLRAIAPDCRFLMMTTDGDDVPRAPCDTLIVRKPFDLPDVIRQVDTQVTRR